MSLTARPGPMMKAAVAIASAPIAVGATTDMLAHRRGEEALRIERRRTEQRKRSIESVTQVEREQGHEAHNREQQEPAA